MIRAEITLKISFVINIYDDFTNAPIDMGAVRINVPLGQKIIKKDKGCVVFLGCAKQQMEVEIESSFYHTQKISVDLTKLEGNCPVIKIRMLPGSSYPLSSGTTCLTGTATSGQMIYVFYENTQAAVKLLCDYNMGSSMDVIRLYHPGESDLEGRTFCIQNKGKAQQEYCRIGNAINPEAGSYQLIASLQHTYTRMGTNLYPVFTGRTDERGNYFLPIKEMNQTEPCCCQMIDSDGTEVQKKIITLNNGCINRLDW